MKPTTSEPKNFKAGKKQKFKKGRRPNNNNDNNNEGDEGGRRFKKPYSKRLKQKELLRRKAKAKIDSFPGDAPIAPSKLKKYKRGEAFDINSIQTIKEKHRLRNQALVEKEATINAARNELLETEESGYLIADKGEETFRFTQKQISKHVDIATAAKNYNLDLFNFGPYRIDYSRTGRDLLLGGQKGHIAAFDALTKHMYCEFNVMETVMDVQWINMATLFAAAQKKWVKIYDKKGIEVHTIKSLHDILRLTYLPNHTLLVSSSEKGILSWLDTYIGTMVKQTFSGAGPIHVLKQNPYNSTILTGHNNGSVSLWSPNSDKPLVKILCHPSHPVRALTITQDGNYLVTGGNDKSIKIWDMRMNHKELKRYIIKDVPRDLDYSQTGLLAVGNTSVVDIYKEVGRTTHITPYLRHCLNPYQDIKNVQFMPFEDCLGIGNAQGFASILVPGSGIANYDALELNPYMTKKQRQEAEVKALLVKIPSEHITLDPNDIGKVHVKSLREKWEERKQVLHVRPKELVGNKMVPTSTVSHQQRPKAYKAKKQSLI